MKPIRSFLIFMLIAAASQLLAQAPQRFNYQAVARDASGNLISEKNLGVKISILDNTEAGTTLYAETFTPKTSKQGLFSVQVGSGNVETGSFNTIPWGSSPKFLKVEIDVAGGSAYELLGTSQLLSVPYALAADRLASPLPISELADVSDVVPMVDQVLKWDGTSWTPGSGSGALVTSDEFLGNGSSGDPLKLAPQGATSGQVLQWSGTNWTPATISGGVGDNWGTQSVVTNSTLSGVGTAASPLGLAQQGATPGLVLKWSGSAWSPAADGGDNWGTAKVNTSTQLTGDGTPGNPLKLGQNGAETGQYMQWSGTGWVPADGGGSLTLPASGNVSDPGVALQIQNNTGTGIVGINAAASAASVFGMQGRILSSTGAGTAGVSGRHGSTGSNGYGVFGLHDGSGAGVYGEATGAGTGLSGKAGTNGIGVYGNATGTTGSGIVGVGNTGVGGTTNTAAGNGIYGNATAGGYAGWFDERVLIRSNSTASTPNLYIWENDMNDKTRIRFNNGITNEFWDLGARTTSSAGNDLDKFTITHFTNGDILTVSGDKRVGINLTNPDAELDVNGSLKVSGGIKVNSTFGTNGQVLTSTGTGAQWKSSTNGLYSNTYFFDQTTERNINNNTDDIPGLAGMSITLAGPAKVIFTFSHSQFQSIGAGDQDVQVNMGFTTSTSVMVNQATIKEVIEAGKTRSISYTHHCDFASGGQYFPFVGVTTNGQLKIVGKSGTISTGQVTIQVIPQ